MDVQRDVPDMEPISRRLTVLINAIPDLHPTVLEEQEGHIVELWKKREQLDVEVQSSLAELQTLQERLTDIHEGFVIGEKRAKQTVSLQNRNRGGGESP